ncbi:MAG: hypothetical protein LBQ04_02325 [Endomicrobium sp.]|nr:hypothetical protein [Endomicrobium sp.]
MPKQTQGIADRKLILFKQNPRHPSLKVHKFVISGNIKIYEVYINMNYRMTFEFFKDKIIFKNIGTYENHR